MLHYIILAILVLFKSDLTFGSDISDQEFKLGLENLSDSLLDKLVSSKARIGLITNQTGIDQTGQRNVDLLLQKGLNIKILYAPEHGIDGKIDAEKYVGDSTDSSRVPVISLYGGDSKFKKFHKHDLKDIDLFIFDIQDSGMRHYTYISVLYRMMAVAAEFNKKFIVADRPNPLGIPMEGPISHKNLISFISIAPIPLRHGLTIAELAKCFNKYYLKKPANLIVAPMKNYQRTRGLNGTLPIFLSPNIANIQACLNYSFLGLLGEISPISVLVGTDYAFRCIMLENSIKFPIKNWDELRKQLQKCNVTSSFLKYKKDGKNYMGLKISINDINKFSGMNTLLVVLNFFKKAGIKFSYATNFNKSIGTAHFKNLLDHNHGKLKLSKTINDELRQFLNKVRDLLIYEPEPKIIELKIN